MVETETIEQLALLALGKTRKQRRCCRRRPSAPPYLDAFQPPLPLHDHIAWQIEQLLRRTFLDDVLIATVKRFEYRVEYLYLEEGLPHFRVSRNGQLLGVVNVRVDVRSYRKLPAIRHDLAAYLAGLGFTPDNTRRIEYGARKTSLKTPKRAPNLPGFNCGLALASACHEAAYAL